MSAFPQDNGVGVAFCGAGHGGERVVGYGAGEGDAGFDAPVVSVREERGVVVEEAALGVLEKGTRRGRREGGWMLDIPGLKSAHMVVALLSGVLDLLFFHGFHVLSCAVLIDPGREAPHCFGYHVECDTDVASSGCLLNGGSYLFDELFTPRFVVEEDPWIPKVVIELLLDAAHAGYCAVDF